MRFPPRTSDMLTGVITSDGGPYPHRSGPKIIAFFNALGWRDGLGVSFGSLNPHNPEKLEKGTPKMRDTVLAAFNMWGEPNVHPAAAAEFNTLLNRNGYRLTKTTGPGWVENEREVEGVPRFTLVAFTASTVEPVAPEAVSHATPGEHMEKCRAKIASGESAGAITNAYTLIEAVLKELPRQAGVAFKSDEGDIRALYTALNAPLHLDPKDESLEVHLRTVLDGFQKLVSGLYAGGNKASDRHDRRYHPTKLVVNAAFALGDFLYDTYAYQRARRATEAA